MGYTHTHHTTRVGVCVCVCVWGCVCVCFIDDAVSLWVDARLTAAGEGRGSKEKERHTEIFEMLWSELSSVPAGACWCLALDF
jgi:hypothetical protein